MIPGTRKSGKRYLVYDKRSAPWVKLVQDIIDQDKPSSAFVSLDEYRMLCNEVERVLPQSFKVWVDLFKKSLVESIEEQEQIIHQLQAEEYPDQKKLNKAEGILNARKQYLDLYKDVEQGLCYGGFIIKGQEIRI